MLIFLLLNNSLDHGLMLFNPDAEITLSGFTLGAWLIDVKAKYAILDVKNEQQRLQGLKTKLQQLLSTDKKIELELEELSKQI